MPYILAMSTPTNDNSNDHEVFVSSEKKVKELSMTTEGTSRNASQKLSTWA